MTSAALLLAVLPNIFGITGRLEQISCPAPGHVVEMSRAQRVYQNAEESCGSVPEHEFEGCFKNVVKKSLPGLPVVFTGHAVADKKTFNMTITTVPVKKVLFSSVREGTHGDLNNGGVNLMFYRAGIPSDTYMIESARLGEDMKSTTSLIVPVKRRLLSDQVYFFFDCELRWVY